MLLLSYLFLLLLLSPFFFFVAADVVVHEDNYCFYSFPILTPFFFQQNLDSKTSFTADDMEKYGANLFCGMQESDVGKLSNDAVEQYLTEFDECEQLDTPTRTAIADKALEASKYV